MILACTRPGLRLRSWSSSSTCTVILQFVNLYRLASCLEGCNSEEKGPMWTGASGANGKSKMGLN